MSSTNQRLIEKAKDDYLTDYQPFYRQDIFGEVWPTTAWERRKNRRLAEFNENWGINAFHQAVKEAIETNDQWNGVKKQLDRTIKSSEERNEAIKKVFDSLSTV